jgi:hypothetical protein
MQAGTAKRWVPPSMKMVGRSGGASCAAPAEASQKSAAQESAA